MEKKVLEQIAENDHDPAIEYEIATKEAMNMTVHQVIEALESLPAPLRHYILNHQQIKHGNS